MSRTYVIRHGKGWRYKRRVPRDLRSFFPQQFLVRYLGDVSRTDAEIAARKLAVEHDEQFKILRSLSDRERAIVAAPPILRPAVNWAGGELSSDVDWDRIARIKAGDFSAPPSHGLASLIPVWMRQNKPRSDEAMRLHVRRFIEIIGDVPARDITRDHVARFRDELEANASLSRITVSKHLEGLHTLFRAAMSANVVEGNPAAGIKPSKAGGKFSAQSRKLPFTAEQVRLIFKTMAGEHRDMQWMLRLLAYTGARSGELAQLRVDDVDTIEGIPVLRIHDKHGSLKNRYSVRDIPIPPACLGIVEYAQQVPGPWLFDAFPERSDGSKARGVAFQRKAGRFLRGKCEIADRALTAHSFRHRWRTIAREIDMPEPVSKAIMGHAMGSGDHSAYGSVVSLAKRAEWMGRVDPAS